MRYLVLLLVILTSACQLFAKEGKIKLGKQGVYTGEIVNKTPSGKGSLIFRTPKDKKTDFAIINGDFNGLSVINNSTIAISGYTLLQTKGYGTFSYIVNGKDGRFTLELKSPKIVNFSDTLLANSICFDFSLINDQWRLGVKSTPMTWMTDKWQNTVCLQTLDSLCENGEIVMEKVSFQTPAPLESREWNISHAYLYSKFIQQDNISSEEGYYALNEDCNYIYNPAKYEFTNVASNLSFQISKTSTAWCGYRVVRGDNDNILLIHRQSMYNNEVEIRDYDLNRFAQVCALNSKGESWAYLTPTYSYKGTIKDCDNVSFSDFKQNDIKYITGEHIEYSQIMNLGTHTQWYNGEPEKQIRERLTSKGVSASDLHDAVLKGRMSEDKALQEQIKRNEWQECRRKGILPTFTTRSDIESFLKWQPKQIGKYLNDWKTVTKLCDSDPASSSYYSQDPLDLEIYRQSTQYNADVNRFKVYKDNFYAFTIPLENVSVNGNSFTLKIRRGWYRGLCKTKRENYLYLEYYSGNSADGTYTFIVPIKRQNLKPKYFDFAPEEITYPTSALQLLKKVRDTNMTSKVELYMVFKPGCIEDPKAHQSWRIYYLNPVGLYLIDSMTGKIIIDMSSVLGRYSEAAVKEILREQKRYDETT